LLPTTICYSNALIRQLEMERCAMNDKVIIVEGKTDKQQLMRVLDEPVHIICTYGTISFERLEELSEELEEKDVFVLVDADDAGEKLRRQLTQEIPHAEHLYITMLHREVAETPLNYLTRILRAAKFKVLTV
jgi:toprim domain protein